MLFCKLTLAVLESDCMVKWKAFHLGSSSFTHRQCHLGPEWLALDYNLTNTTLRHFIQKTKMWCYRLGGTKIQQDLVMLDSINLKKTLKKIFSEK